MNVVPISLVGLLLFFWPFLAASPAPAAVSAAVAAGAILLLLFIELATRRLDARRFALLATIAALDAALRLVLVIGIGGFSPIFFLILIAGYAYGPSFGFLCGATSLLASAIATGGIGPWLPYQMFACGWVGAIAGIAGVRRAGRSSVYDIAILAVTGVITGYLFGALMDTWDWTTFYRGAPQFGWQPGLPFTVAGARFVRFYAATSFVYDSLRAAGNAIAVLVLGSPVLAALARLRSRFTVTVIRPQPVVMARNAKSSAATAPPTTQIGS